MARCPYSVHLTILEEDPGPTRRAARPARCSAAPASPCRAGSSSPGRPARFGISAGATTRQSCPNLPIQAVSFRTRFEAALSLPCRAASFLISRSMRAGVFSTSPRNSTSPFRPGSATATRASSSRHRMRRTFRYTSPMVRPPCVGSARPVRATLVALVARRAGRMPQLGNTTSRADHG